jgi:hypothetical protein
VNRINKWEVEPGPYADEKNFQVVVTDIIEHSWNGQKQLVEYSPLVVARDLVGSLKYCWPLEVFKEKFRKI